MTETVTFSAVKDDELSNRQKEQQDHYEKAKK